MPPKKFKVPVSTSSGTAAPVTPNAAKEATFSQIVNPSDSNDAKPKPIKKVKKPGVINEKKTGNEEASGSKQQTGRKVSAVPISSKGRTTKTVTKKAETKKAATAAQQTSSSHAKPPTVPVVPEPEKTVDLRERAARTNLAFPGRTLDYDSISDSDSQSLVGPQSAELQTPVKRTILYDETPRTHVPQKRVKTAEPEHTEANKMIASNPQSNSQDSIMSSSSGSAPLTILTIDPNIATPQNSSQESVIMKQRLSYNQSFGFERKTPSFKDLIPPQEKSKVNQPSSVPAKPAFTAFQEQSKAPQSAPGQSTAKPQSKLLPTQHKKQSNAGIKTTKSTKNANKENLHRTPLSKPRSVDTAELAPPSATHIKQSRGSDISGENESISQFNLSQGSNVLSENGSITQGIKQFQVLESNSSIGEVTSVSHKSEGTSTQRSSQSLAYSQPAPDLGKKETLGWLRDRRFNGTWVECVECKKWRHLKNHHDAATVPEDWFCEMNDDEEFNSCDKIEKRVSLVKEAEMIFTKYSVGSLVWAQVDGYPFWPAMIDDDPDYMQFYWFESHLSVEPEQYHVVFFDKKPSRAWVTQKQLKLYEGEDYEQTMSLSEFNRGKARVSKKGLKAATKEISLAYEMDQRKRVHKYGLLARGFRISN